jgi:ribosomal protein S18 acetylase RimI-like enzyme
MSLMSTATTRSMNIRCMEVSDLPRLLQIEKQPPGPRWTRRDFITDLQSNDRGILVAEIRDYVIGYLVYQVSPVDGDAELPSVIGEDPAHPLQPVRISLLHTCVAPEWRRRGVGRKLIERFEPELRQQNDCIAAAVPESNLPAQLLLRSVGYRATEVLRRHFGNEDAYLMERVKT